MMRARRRGFVLIAALWLLVALGAVGLDAALRSKERRLPAANLLDEARARQAAIAGGEFARSRLTAAVMMRETEMRARTQRTGGGAQQARIAATRILASGQADNPWLEPQQLVNDIVSWGELRFTIDVYDTGSLIHINIVPEDLLLRFFTQGLRIDYVTASRLVQAILDWRDEDDFPRVGGAERDEYIAAGAAVLPANNPFRNVEELRYVMGMTPELYDRIRPFVTVIGSGRISVNAAPVEVLAALPGMTHGHALTLVRARNAGRYPANQAELRAITGMPPARSTAETQEFNRRVTYATNEVAIVSEGHVEGSPVRRTATLVAARSSTGAVVTWRRID